MKIRASLLSSLLFVVAAAINLSALWIGRPHIASVVKPLLMPLLALSAYSFQKERFSDASFTRKTLYDALAFHTIGDILLIFSGSVFFFLGMAAFFVGHVFYFLTLPYVCDYGKSRIRWSLIQLFIGVMVAALVLLLNSFGLSSGMVIPLALYGLVFPVLVGKSLEAAFVSRWYLLSAAGFLLFALSDTILACGKFGGMDFVNQGFCVMATYLAAQVMIVCGIIKAQCCSGSRAVPDSEA